MGKTVKAVKPVNKKKSVPPAPLASQTKVKKTQIYEKTPRSFRIGGDIQPVGDLTRFVRWPAYIRLQRQKRILAQRVKVPPSIAQFQHTLDKAQFVQLVRLCKTIAPETKLQKKNRLRDQAVTMAKGGKTASTCPPTLKFGINHVAELVEQKKAKLVVIAHDVDPVELVCWLPALCRKKGVPFCVVKSKSRLGQLVNKKTCCAVAITSVKKENAKDLETLVESATASFNDNKELTKKWGGGVLGHKSQHIVRAYQKKLEHEANKKAGLV